MNRAHHWIHSKFTETAIVARITAAAALATAASGQVVYVGGNNPGGIPDITQDNLPICGASAAANLLWNWSEFAPYDGSAGGQRLVDHPATANPPQNWPATWGNWSADSIGLRNTLADQIYGPVGNNGTRAGGKGMGGGITEYNKSRGHLWKGSILGFGGNPDGLSVRTYNGNQATYANMRPWVVNNDGSLPYSTAIANVAWHNGDGTWVNNNNNKSRHALAVAGLNLNNTELYLTNGWGTHQNAANPVDIAYYDRYTGIQNNGNNAGRLQIPSGNGAHNGNAGNNYLVRGIANSNNADYVEMYQTLVVKKGGCPEVGLDVQPMQSNPNENRYDYKVFNPEPNPQQHFFLELNPSVLSQISLSDVLKPTGWSVEYWHPGGTIADAMATPQDGLDLFGPTGAVENSADNPTWTPTMTGLHWYWNGGGSPVAGGMVSASQALGGFGFDLSSSIPYTRADTNLTVVGELGNGVDYYNMIGGPIPEPASAVLLVSGLLITLRRRK